MLGKSIFLLIYWVTMDPGLRHQYLKLFSIRLRARWNHAERDSSSWKCWYI